MLGIHAGKKCLQLAKIHTQKGENVTSLTWEGFVIKIKEIHALLYSKIKFKK
jgi:hypothetical protein